jgi:hypothetical protein
MSPDAQRIAIAEACGWKPEIRKMYGGEKNVKGWGFNTHLGLGDKDRAFTQFPQTFPDYLADLNAIIPAITKLPASERDTYQNWLSRIVEREHRMATITWLLIHADAAQRAEALLRTIHLWDDSK